MRNDFTPHGNQRTQKISFFKSICHSGSLMVCHCDLLSYLRRLWLCNISNISIISDSCSAFKCKYWLRVSRWYLRLQVLQPMVSWIRQHPPSADGSAGGVG
uniref:Ovule protein n=1 Tax=Echinococcus granulosus TaxID=6210 RepID=A0A068WP24_ECHGR|nr:hypothetical protein EgrG_000081300 [Echinococcus granulosus]